MGEHTSEGAADGAVLVKDLGLGACGLVQFVAEHTSRRYAVCRVGRHAGGVGWLRWGGHAVDSSSVGVGCFGEYLHVFKRQWFPTRKEWNKKADSVYIRSKCEGLFCERSS